MPLDFNVLFRSVIGPWLIHPVAREISYGGNVAVQTAVISYQFRHLTPIARSRQGSGHKG